MDARRALRATARVLVATLSAGALVLSGFAWSVAQRLDFTDLVTSEAIARARPTVDGESFTALLVGLDARTDAAGNPLPPALLEALHAGPDEGQLHTDTIMVLHVPGGADARAVAISIPRDSFVPIAGGRGTHKINSAYRRGIEDAQATLVAQGGTGPELDRRGREAGRGVLLATVESLTGLAVDHYAEINLAGFVELTEALGGVPVCLNAPVSDVYSGVDLPAGAQTVSGPGALAFVRQRHGLEHGDLDRIARQQAFVSGLAQRLQSSGTFTDPGRLDRLVDVVTRHVVIDRGWDIEQALAQLRRLSGDDLSFRTIPTGRPDLDTPVDGIAVEIDQEAVRAFVASVESGGPVVLPSDTPTAPTPTAPTPASQLRPAPTPTPTGPPQVITAGGVPCVD